VTTVHLSAGFISNLLLRTTNRVIFSNTGRSLAAQFMQAQNLPASNAKILEDYHDA